MHTNVALVGLVILASHGCSKHDGVSNLVPPSSRESVSNKMAVNERPKPQPPASGADAAAAVVAHGPPSVPLVALSDGARIRIKGVGVGPLELTVPAGFKLKMEHNEELGTKARLKGPDFEIVVEYPEGGFPSLTEQKASLLSGDPATVFFHAEEASDGYLLVDKSQFGGTPGRQFEASVLRPSLKARCSGWALSQLSEAELAGSICLSLRAATAAKAK